VYGLGCALHSVALGRLAAAKKRDFKPFLLLDNDPPALEGLRWSAAARRLALAFWPGALTLVLPAEPGAYPSEVTGAEGSVAVRSSPHAGVRALAAALGGPITSTSANVPGEAPALAADAAAEVMHRLGLVDGIVLDGGSLAPSRSSTIVDGRGTRPRVSRHGVLTIERLRSVCEEIDG
jgi:L-threonylcarbamoyladenylate synthase